MQMPPRLNEPDECLTGEVIAGLNRGLLSDEQLDRIGTHLSHCTKCQAALSQWTEPPGDDPFADRLKRCLQLPPVPDTPTLLAIEAAAVAVTLSRSRTGPFLAEAATLAARATVGPYDLLERVGRGGMGVVHRARHRVIGRVVAVKMIRADGASERTVIRFRREAEAIARLDHPNIVRLYDFGEEDGAPYYSMEFVDGGTLSDLLRAGPLDCRAAATIVRTLAGAMAYSHQNEVVHRDLKPANVLRAADNTLKIADFGLAKLLDDPRRLSLTGGIMGTANYYFPA